MKVIAPIFLLFAVLPVHGQNDSTVIEKLKAENFLLKLQVRELAGKLSESRGDTKTVISSLEQDVTDNEDVFFSIVDKWDALTGTDSVDDNPLSSINSLDAIIRTDDNETVLKYIEIYTVRKKNLMLGAFMRYDQNRVMIEKTFAEYGVPAELSSLCIVESAASTKAMSKAGAVGLWQLMPATAIQYGLEVTLFTDDRFDAQKSTKAAARYLSDQYKRYRDWRLVLMSYNCGTGKLDKAITAAGGKATYNDLLKKLPRETRDYVPAFVAIQYVNSNRGLLAGK